MGGGLQHPGVWHFRVNGPTPELLVKGRERIYFDYFWNDFAADKTRSIPEADRKAYAAAYTRPGRMKAGWAYFVSFESSRPTCQPAATSISFRSYGADCKMAGTLGRLPSGPCLCSRLVPSSGEMDLGQQIDFRGAGALTKLPRSGAEAVGAFWGCNQERRLEKRRKSPHCQKKWAESSVNQPACPFE